MTLKYILDVTEIKDLQCVCVCVQTFALKKQEQFEETFCRCRKPCYMKKYIHYFILTLTMSNFSTIKSHLNTNSCNQPIMSQQRYT